MPFSDLSGAVDINKFQSFFDWFSNPQLLPVIFLKKSTTDKERIEKTKTEADDECNTMTKTEEKEEGDQTYNLHREGGRHFL